MSAPPSPIVEGQAASTSAAVNSPKPLSPNEYFGSPEHIVLEPYTQEPASLVPIPTKEPERAATTPSVETSPQDVTAISTEQPIVVEASPMSSLRHVFQLPRVIPVDPPTRENTPSADSPPSPTPLDTITKKNPNPMEVLKKLQQRR